MKTKILSCLLGGLGVLAAQAQIQFIDLTTRTTNTVTGGAQITISNVCSAAPYTVTNTQNIVVGDPIPTAFGKVNADFNYLSNQMVQTLNLPNQINTNLNAYLILESNRVNAIVLTNVTLSTGLDATRYAITNFLHTNVVYVAGGTIYFDSGHITSDGSGDITALGNFSFAGGALTSDRYGAITGSTYTDNDNSDGTSVNLHADGYGGFCAMSAGGNTWTFSGNNYGNSQGTGTWSVYDGAIGNSPLLINEAGQIGINEITPAYQLDITGDFGDSSDGTYYMDSGGNLTCTSVTQTSDVNSKTNIIAFDTAGALANLLSLPVYQWNFKDRMRTNYQQKIIYTNIVVQQTNTRVPIATNLVAMVRTNILSKDMHIGPMAQDWSARFGGKTNAISIIDMQGVLLAGEQALADPARVQAMPFLKLSGFTVTHSTNSTFGYGAGLVACDAGFIYVSTGTNAWRRVALAAGGW